MTSFPQGRSSYFLLLPKRLKLIYPSNPFSDFSRFFSIYDWLVPSFLFHCDHLATEIHQDVHYDQREKRSEREREEEMPLYAHTEGLLFYLISKSSIHRAQIDDWKWIKCTNFSEIIHNCTVRQFHSNMNESFHTKNRCSSERKRGKEKGREGGIRESLRNKSVLFLSLCHSIFIIYFPLQPILFFFSLKLQSIKEW